MTAVLNIKHGCFFPSPNNVYTFDQVEYAVGRKFDNYCAFISFDSQVTGHSEFLTAANAGHDLVISWAPTRTIGLTFANILAGAFNAKLDEWFTYFVAMPQPVYIRWAWEMNGSYMQYSPLFSAVASNSSHCLSTAQYVSVWQYVVDRQRTLFPSVNIKWFFNSNQNDTPTATGNTLESFYPGNTYVDVIGYTSYNSLNGLFMTPTQTFAGKTNNTQADNYARTAALHPTAPVWIGETGCVDANDPKDITPTIYPGHSKSQWIIDAFETDTTTAGFPRLAAINWFDVSGTRNWAFNSTQTALTTFHDTFSTAGVAAPPPADVPGQPPSWFGFDLPFPETHDATRDHRAEHSAFKHFINQITSKVGGWVNLIANTDGTQPGLRVVGSALGDALVAMVRIEAPTGTKRAFALRDKANTFDTFVIGMEGRHEWGDGVSSVRDAVLYRAGTATVGTPNNFSVGGTLSSTASTGTKNTFTPVAATPAPPGVGGGVVVYGETDALKAKSGALAWTMGPLIPAVHKFWVSVDPASAGATVVLVSGQVYLTKVQITEAKTLTQIGFQTTVVAAGSTSAVVGLYDTTGALLVSSVDQGAGWETTGEKKITIPGTLVKPSVYHVAVLWSGTTGPALCCATSAAANFNLFTSQARASRMAAGGLVLPSTLALGSAALRNEVPFVGAY